MAPEPKEFKEATIYAQGDFIHSNIVRIDAAKAKIWIGPDAQRRESVFVEYTQKGKRKPQTLVRSDSYVVVVPTALAIQPDDFYLPPVAGVSSQRYGVTDARWKTDFDEQLRSANVPMLADFRRAPADVEIREPVQVASGSHLPAAPSELATDSEYESTDLEYAEGLRHQAERNFFQRNPALIKQAKAIYGYSCQVCGFNFATTYGELGSDFAEGHHINPLSERPPEEWTTAIQTNIADVAVLCANCHRMIHRRKPALSIDELKAIRNGFQIQSDSAANTAGS